MIYNDFKNTVRDFPIIVSANIFLPTVKPQALRRQLSRWQARGLVCKLKKGVYILNKNDRKIHPSRIFLANQLYSLSYVSTEYALGYYGLIPEKVADVTSATTRKTAEFSNPFGTFRYQHLKTELFFGFREIEDENRLPVFIAEPEKAVLDFIYLNLSSFRNQHRDIFSLSYRFQNLETLKQKRLIEYTGRYQSRQLQTVVEDFLHFMKRGD